jgi:hypothetical protein
LLLLREAMILRYDMREWSAHLSMSGTRDRSTSFFFFVSDTVVMEDREVRGKEGKE